jgi:hypothetical protein
VRASGLVTALAMTREDELVQPLAPAVREVHAGENPAIQFGDVRHARVDDRHGNAASVESGQPRQPCLHLVGPNRLVRDRHLPGNLVIARERVDLGVIGQIAEPVRRNLQHRSRRQPL